MLRFHLDEHVAHAIASGLRAKGVDVTTTVDAGLLGADDASHLAFALAAQRVVFSHDDDFLRYAASTNHAGVAYCHQGKYGAAHVGAIVRQLYLMQEVLKPVDMKNRVEFV